LSLPHKQSDPVTQRLVEYYRCPEECSSFGLVGALSTKPGYFRFGSSTICYGRYAGRQPASRAEDQQFDAFQDLEIKNGTVRLPFDPSEVVDNLRFETYAPDWRSHFPHSALAPIYYFLRPFLPVRIRKHMQELHFRGWKDLAFPRWPVDCSVDDLLSQLLALSLKTNGVDRMPFIWFWPEGASSCAIMTHDVETKLGCRFCSALMDIDDAAGVKASFQVIPEQRYIVTPEFLASIRDRGFEIVVHDLNHDGHLYRNRKQFLRRASKINSYATLYGADGFRAATLYRKQLWYDALEFAYDMSVPNVGHLDPQRGGCCTVMPFFIGKILELPVTTTQDYTLFNILNDYSTDLWQRQIQTIREKHGLMSFIVHPDYIVKTQQRSIYKALLARLGFMRENDGLWIATPGEVNRWWRQRSKMRLNKDGNRWRIEGPGSERARLAYATLQGDILHYQWQGTSDVPN
jgi:hypothetical protein